MTPSTRARICPPVDGSITLPETLAFHELHNADIPMFVFCEDGQAEITEISYRQFAHACYATSRRLNLQRNSASGKPVVALIALSDTLIHQTTVLGLMHAGFIVSTFRNTAKAIANLIRIVDCHQVLATCTSLQSVLNGTKEEIHKVEPGYSITILEMPTISQLFPELSTPQKSNSFTESPEVAKPDLDEIALYLHSSGSTGLPKAIPKTHRELIEFAAFSSTTYLRDHNPPLRIAAMHLPPFHALGLHCQINFPLLCCITVAIYPPSVVALISTPDNILDHLQRTACNVVVAVPSLLQIWAQNVEHVNILSNLVQVNFSGGALSPQIGRFLIEKGVKLITNYGATEFGGPSASSTREGDEKDWEYLEFTQRSKVRWISQGNGLYECQFLTCETHHISIANLSDARGYATSDLFVPHPTKSYLWKIVGRIDDVIVHSTGEKTVTTPIENILYSNPHIVGAVMFGHARNQPGVLIEPSRSYRVDITKAEEVEKFRNLIWPVVEEANSISPAFSQIFKEVILIADYKKPFPRASTGKGTVTRKATLDLYAAEIEALYSSMLQSKETTEQVLPIHLREKEYLEQWIMDQARALSAGKFMSPSVNLFEQGFDSLSATILRHRIISALPLDEPNARSSVLQRIDPNIIYTHPTIASLAERLANLVSNPNALNELEDHVDMIENLIRRYSFEPTSRNLTENADAGRVVVLLTGSTGHLGSHILSGLLCNPQISTVYTLNRPHIEGLSAQSRHRKRFIEESLDVNLLSSKKLIQMEGDCENNNLGISDFLYSELLSEVTIVIHVSWRLDFNLPLSLFEPNIKQTHNLIKFARACAYGSRTRFLFTSSVGVGQSWNFDDGLYPEDIVLDAKCAVGMGYGESKYVAERILHTSGLDAISLRIDQITGSPENGSWATTDWVPILIKSSINLGAFPSVVGRVSWIPVATVSDIIRTLIYCRHPYPSALNIVHPTGTSWDVIMRYCSDTIYRESQNNIPLLPFQDWFTLLRQRYDSSKLEDVANVPAIKLYDFFRRMAKIDQPKKSQISNLEPTTFAVGKITEIQNILQGLSDFTGEEVDRWIKYWIQVGYLD